MPELEASVVSFNRSTFRWPLIIAEPAAGLPRLEWQLPGYLAFDCYSVDLAATFSSLQEESSTCHSPP